MFVKNKIELIIQKFKYKNIIKVMKINYLPLKYIYILFKYNIININ